VILEEAIASSPLGRGEIVATKSPLQEAFQSVGTIKKVCEGLCNQKIEGF
jgi:hypothetical protein